MDPVYVFNALEAGWWFVLAILAAIFGGRARGFTRATRIATPLFLVTFGASDLIELYTGAWWRPPALLALKGICLIGLVACAADIYRRRWRSEQQKAPGS
jgi:hypothetical protein